MKLLIAVIGMIFLAPAAFGSPILDGIAQQTECNKKGFFYDHHKQECTNHKLISCDDKNIKDVAKAKKWKEMQKKLFASGYTMSQCVSQHQNQYTIGFVKKGVFVEYKNVRLAH